MMNHNLTPGSGTGEFQTQLGIGPVLHLPYPAISTFCIPILWEVNAKWSNNGPEGIGGLPQ